MIEYLSQMGLIDVVGFFDVVGMFDVVGVFDVVGIAGSLLICLAYWSVSSGWMTADSRAYHVTNLTGALLLLSSLYFRPNPGAILIEVIWAGIAIYSLIRLKSVKPNDSGQ